MLTTKARGIKTMYNDEHEDNNSHSGTDQQKNRYGKKQPDDDHSFKRSRDRQRTTAIALSVITCLFMCVIGYEIIRENTPKREEPIANLEKKTSSLILTKNSNIPFSDQPDEDGEEDSYENHQIRFLQEQNRKQAAKIKALRQELVEKMHGTHEIKASLFKQDGDPRDRAKIADLSQQLEEKERSINELADLMKNLEFELSTLQRKIDHSEVTREALAAMIEHLRTTKEQEYTAAQQRLEEQQQMSGEEILALKESIAQLETSLATLDKDHKEKVDALDRINQELAEHYNLLDSKTQEHQSLSEMFQQTQESMTNQVLNLMATLEWEATSKARVTNELQKALEKQKLEKDTVIGLLESELEKRNAIISAKEKEEPQVEIHHAREQLLNLVATLELEMTRASFLQHDLDRTVYLQRQNMQVKALEIDALEHDLKKQKLILESKGEELENLASVLHLTRDAHHQQIHELVVSHQYESLRAQQLEDALAVSVQEKDDLSHELSDPTKQHAFKDAKIQELENIVTELKQEVDAKDTLLAARQLELRTLLASEVSAAHFLRQQTVDLAHQIETGNIQLQQLHEDVKNAAAQKELNTEQQNKIKELESSLLALSQNLQKKETLLTEKESQLEELIQKQNSSEQLLKSQMEELAQVLNRESARLAELEHELEHAKVEHERGQQDTMHLNEQLQSHRSSLQSKEDEINRLTQSREKLEADLSNKISQLQAQIQKEQEYATTLQDKIQEQNQVLAEQTQQQNDYEARLNTLSNEILGKEKDLLATEEKLLLAMPQLEMLSTQNQHLQNSHGDLDEKFQETKNLLVQQQQQIAELNQRLEDERRTFQEAFAKQEEQRRHALQAHKKLELSSLRTALLEDQLNITNATLRQQHEAIATLEQSQVVLKDDYEQQLDKMREIITAEKDRTREYRKTIAAYKENEAEAANVAALEEEIKSLRQQLAERVENAEELNRHHNDNNSEVATEL